ncbi:MAG: hypothetical protein LBQ26_00645 [Holosporales bacterium]|jgi:hypothetical protein|nr:hypothetical protein [Holosporales bacterium]
MTPETLKKAWQAPAIFVFGNDTSAKHAFTLWLEQAAQHEGYKIDHQKATFIKGFSPSTQEELFVPQKTFLVLEGVTDATLPSLDPIFQAFLPEGRVLVLLAPESRKIAPYFSHHPDYIPCGFFKNAQDRLTLFQFFFTVQGEPPPSVPATFLLSRDIEEQFANTCQKWWLLRANPDACARLCREAAQPTQWDVEMLRALEPIAATRLLLARALKTLESTEPLLKFFHHQATYLCQRGEILNTLLEAEIAFKRKHAPPKSVLFRPFLRP